MAGALMLTLICPPDLSARMARGFIAPKPRYTTGAYAKYAALVRSASQGAVTSFPFDAPS